MAQSALNKALDLEKDGGSKSQDGQARLAAIKRRAMGLFEVALMLELYYGTNSQADQQRRKEIRETLAKHRDSGIPDIAASIQVTVVSEGKKSAI